MLIMWFGKQAYCMAAFLATELFSVALLLFSVLAQATPDANTFHSLSPKAMVIGAYTAMFGVIIGGVIQILQLFVNSRNTKLEAQLRERAIQDEAEKKIRQVQDEARTTEKEMIKQQVEVLRQQAIWLQGWQTTILNQKPGEPYGNYPTFNPDPNTSTPQAIEQAKTFPLVATPLVDTNVPALVPLPEGVMKSSSSGFFPAIGTPNATVKENTENLKVATEELKVNTEALKEVSKKL